MKKMLVVLAVLMTFVSANAFALTTYTFVDHWDDWGNLPEYSTGIGDLLGTPIIDEMIVTVSDDNLLASVSIVLDENNTQDQQFSSLFINTYNIATTYGNYTWDDWDYFVHYGGSQNAGYATGDVPGDGIYSVASGYEYTMTVLDAPGSRPDNPNGIDADFLTAVQGYVAPIFEGNLITYNLLGAEIDVTDGFFVAYAPWCANDVVGGGTPVPEPGTLLLFGGGLVGLAYLCKRKKA